MYRKISILTLILAILLSVASAGCSSKPSGSSATDGDTAAPAKTYEWKLALEEGPGGIEDTYALKFKELIEKKSNGNIKINIYYLGQLGDGVNQFELVQNGAIELGFMTTGATGTLVPETQLFSLHFLFPDDPQKALEFMYESKAINEDLKNAYLAKSLIPLEWAQTGYFQWTGNKMLKKPSDFKGFKMRCMVSPLIAAQFQAYGADTITVPYGELYTALQLGMADGETNPVNWIDSSKFYEVQKYLFMINSEFCLIPIVGNSTWWNNLPDDIKKIVNDTFQEVRPYFNDKVAEIEKTSLEKIKKTNIQIIEYTPEEREAFRKAAQVDPVKNKYVELAGPNGKVIMDRFFQEMEAFMKK